MMHTATTRRRISGFAWSDLYCSTQPSYIDLTVSDDYLPKKGIGGHHKSVPTSALNYIDLRNASDCPLLVCAKHTSSKSLTYVDTTSNNSRSVPHLVLPKHPGVRHNLHTVRSDCSVNSSGPGAFYPNQETAKALRRTDVVTSLISESRGSPPPSRVVDGVPNFGYEQSPDMSQSSCEPATVAPLVDFCCTKATIGTAYVNLTSDDWTSNFASVMDQISDNATCNHYASSSFSDVVNGSQWQSTGDGTSSITQNNYAGASDSIRENDVSSVHSKSKPEVKGTRAGGCAPDSKPAESKKAGKDRKPSRHILSEDCKEEDIPYEGPEREEELVRGLRDMKQTPPPGPFSREDLTWLPIRTQGGGRHYIHDVAVIPWRRLQDFREGEGQDKSYPCRFNKETVKKNKPGSLVFPRANSAAKVIK